MPTVLRVQGFRFYFYANEGSEPPHVHVDKGDATGKLWLADVSWAYSEGFSPAQQGTIRHIVQQHHAELRAKWNEFFGL
jgi:hypothetical protein